MLDIHYGGIVTSDMLLAFYGYTRKNFTINGIGTRYRILKVDQQQADMMDSFNKLRKLSGKAGVKNNVKYSFFHFYA